MGKPKAARTRQFSPKKLTMTVVKGGAILQGFGIRPTKLSAYSINVDRPPEIDHDRSRGGFQMLKQGRQVTITIIGVLK